MALVYIPDEVVRSGMGCLRSVGWGGQVRYRQTRKEVVVGRLAQWEPPFRPVVPIGGVLRCQAVLFHKTKCGWPLFILLSRH